MAKDEETGVEQLHTKLNELANRISTVARELETLKTEAFGLPIAIIPGLRFPFAPPPPPPPAFTLPLPPNTVGAAQFKGVLTCANGNVVEFYTEGVGGAGGGGVARGVTVLNLGQCPIQIEQVRVAAGAAAGAAPAPVAGVPVTVVPLKQPRVANFNMSIGDQIRATCTGRGGGACDFEFVVT
jgi:hypothetical protein